MAIWSSASDDYVEEVVKCIIPDDIKLEFVWGRRKCTYCLNVLGIETDGYVDYANHYNYIKPYSPRFPTRISENSDCIAICYYFCNSPTIFYSYGRRQIFYF
ncbi:hypothetical protein MYP_4855 [Sporocytophaga myxococcoides]|uniref:Uncharacterized protein n=1 Tax=Sporocytophaga myxococcoides TaxID=153721 RepID=A0A098LKX3_9BACT|nr:hypothetical protein MYP_4855 [Sporocytophaga myxococcoides]